MNRRRFIYNSSIASLSVLGLNSCNQLFRDVKITILHSNDVHSQIEPFPLNHIDFLVEVVLREEQVYLMKLDRLIPIL